jgi:hypothetical protein
MQNPLYRRILHHDGRVFYDGEPILLADAQVMLNEGIAASRVAVGSFLRVDGDELTIEEPDTAY